MKIAGPFRTKRSLSDYNTAYISEAYPLLAFFFAVYAGGENIVYCDHGADYFEKYCREPFKRRGLPVPSYIEAVAERLGAFDRATEGRTKEVRADEEDWKLFLACLKTEILANENPPLAW